MDSIAVGVVHHSRIQLIVADMKIFVDLELGIHNNKKQSTILKHRK